MSNSKSKDSVWTKFRRFMLRIVEHALFETFILIIIAASSICLTLEDVNMREGDRLYNALKILDYVWAGIFIVEMLFKWFGIGLKGYYTDPWSLLDFLIVIIQILSIALPSDAASTLRVLRSLRALRPLRAISRFPAVRTIVNSVVYSIPQILNVGIICGIFWLIFSIIGVTLFNGKFFRCIHNITLAQVPLNLSECNANQSTTWVNSKINFDNVAIGYLALFQVATFQGWMEIMQDSVDTVDVEISPRKNNTRWVYIFYVAFIVIGSLFILKLIIAVIIDSFTNLKKQVLFFIKIKLKYEFNF
jgi:voltage-gated cation channel